MSFIPEEHKSCTNFVTEVLADQISLKWYFNCFNFNLINQNPYPSEAHKSILARQTGLTMKQVASWLVYVVVFTNVKRTL